MFMKVGEYIFLTFLGLGFAMFLLLIPYVLIMHFLTPRTILDKYFKPPHFGEFERAMFTGIPYAPLRTYMFMSAIAYPHLGKKRRLTEVYRDTPQWFRIASKVFMVLLFVILGGIFISFGLMMVMLLYGTLTGM